MGVATDSRVVAALHPGARRKNRTVITDSNREAKLSRFCHDYVDAGMPGLVYCLQHPGKCLSAFAAVFKLPTLRADLSENLEGSVIRVELSRSSVIRRTIFPLRAVLALPRDQGQYELGSSKKTLRYEARRARRLGVRWCRVDEPAERRKLLQLAAEWEHAHPVEYYRTPYYTDHSPLLDYRLWLAAYSAAGRPLLLSVSPVDGEWALLHYFRTLTTGQEASSARYLMTQVLVEHLVDLRVRYLADPASPLWLANGLRYYQRILGFRLVRFHLVPRGRPRPRGRS
jgi:hypothetical protein